MRWLVVVSQVFLWSGNILPRGSLGSRVKGGVERMGLLPWRHVATDFLDDQCTDGKIRVGLDVVQSSDLGTVELVGGGFEGAVGSFDSGSSGIEVFP